MLLLVLRDLQYRRWRVVLTIAVMAIVMTLLFLMAGLVGQFNAEPYLAAERAGGDMQWVVAKGTGGPFTSPKPTDEARFSAVADGESILVAPSALGDQQVRLVGRSYGLVDDRSGEPRLTAGRYPTGPGDVVVDETAGFDIGDTTTLGGLPVSIVGLTSDATVLAGVPLTFATLEFAQQAAVGGSDMIVAKLLDDERSLPPDLKLMSAEMVGDDALLPLDGAIASVTLVRALLWLITIIIIAATIYITALERTRDFAVLKAVGGRTSRLAMSLLAQGVVMTLAAVAIAGVLQALIAPSFPMTVRVPADAWFTIIGGAVVAAIGAGAAGVMRVRATPAAEAFG